MALSFIHDDDINRLKYLSFFKWKITLELVEKTSKQFYLYLLVCNNVS